MLGFNRWHLFKFVAAIVCITGIVSLALIHFFPAPPSTITFASGFKGSSYELLAAQYKEVLAHSGVTLDARITGGSVENLKLLKDPGSGVSAALVQGGLSNSKEATSLLSLGRINYQIFCVFYRATEVLNDLTELKGKRIAVGPVGTAGRVVAEKILEISGISSENSMLLPFTGQAAANALHDGNADATILGLSSDAPILQSLLRDSRVRLMSVTRAEALTRFFPFLVRLVLPQGAIDFEKNIPVTDIVLFSTTNSVLVRGDLHPAHISLLAQALKETHSKRGLFQQAGEFPTQTDPEYKMAESAVDFYKNGPSFLSRYLPVWIIAHAQRMLALLMAALAIIYPIFELVPKIYKWFLKLSCILLYRNLGNIERGLKTELTARQVVVMQSDLKKIVRIAGLIPAREKELFSRLNWDFDFLRERLATRLNDLRSQTDKVAQGVKL